MSLVQHYVHAAREAFAGFLCLADLREYLSKYEEAVGKENVDAAIEISPKYAERLIIWYRDGRGPAPTGRGYIERMQEAFAEFERLKKLPQFVERAEELVGPHLVGDRNPKDFNSYPDWPTFDQMIDKLSEVKSEKQTLDERIKEGYSQIAEEGGWKLFKLTNQEATTALCRDLVWCIKDPDWSKKYPSRGPLYLVTEGDAPTYLISLTGRAGGPGPEMQNLDPEPGRRAIKWNGLYEGAQKLIEKSEISIPVRALFGGPLSDEEKEEAKKYLPPGAAEEQERLLNESVTGTFLDIRMKYENLLSKIRVDNVDAAIRGIINHMFVQGTLTYDMVNGGVARYSEDQVIKTMNDLGFLNVNALINRAYQASRPQVKQYQNVDTGTQSSIYKTPRSTKETYFSGQGVQPLLNNEAPRYWDRGVVDYLVATEPEVFQITEDDVLNKGVTELEISFDDVVKAVYNLGWASPYTYQVYKLLYGGQEPTPYPQQPSDKYEEQEELPLTARLAQLYIEADQRQYLMKQYAEMGEPIIDQAIRLFRKYAERVLIWMREAGEVDPGQEMGNLRVEQIAYQLDIFNEIKNLPAFKEEAPRKYKFLRDRSPADINSYATFSEFVAVTEDFKDLKSRGAEWDAKSKAGFNEIAENANYSVVQLTTPEAVVDMCKVGKLEWCVHHIDVAMDCLDKGPLYAIFSTGDSVRAEYLISIDGDDVQFQDAHWYDVDVTTLPDNVIDVLKKANLWEAIYAPHKSERLNDTLYATAKEMKSETGGLASHRMADRDWDTVLRTFLRNTKQEGLLDNPDGEALDIRWARQDVQLEVAQVLEEHGWYNDELRFYAQEGTENSIVQEYRNLVNGDADSDWMVDVYNWLAEHDRYEDIEDKYAMLGEGMFVAREPVLEALAALGYVDWDMTTEKEDQWLESLGYAVPDPDAEPTGPGYWQQPLFNPNKPYEGSGYEEQPDLPLTARLAQLYVQAVGGFIRLADLRDYLKKYEKDVPVAFIDELVKEMPKYAERVIIWTRRSSWPMDNPKDTVQGMKPEIEIFDRIKNVPAFKNDSTLKGFLGGKSPADINSYANWRDFLAVVEKYKDIESQGEAGRKDIQQGMKQVYSKDGVDVWKLTNQAAVTELCHNSEWCAKDPERGGTPYLEAGPLFLFKVNGERKFLAHINTGQIRNIEDKNPTWEEAQPIRKALADVIVDEDGDLDIFGGLLWSEERQAKAMEAATAVNTGNTLHDYFRGYLSGKNLSKKDWKDLGKEVYDHLKNNPKVIEQASDLGVWGDFRPKGKQFSVEVVGEALRDLGYISEEAEKDRVSGIQTVYHGGSHRVYMFIDDDVARRVLSQPPFEMSETQIESTRRGADDAFLVVEDSGDPSYVVDLASYDIYRLPDLEHMYRTEMEDSGGASDAIEKALQVLEVDPDRFGTILWDENRWNEENRAATLENIKSIGNDIAVADAPDDWPQKVVDWLSNEGLTDHFEYTKDKYDGTPGGDATSKEDIRQALDALGLTPEAQNRMNQQPAGPGYWQQLMFDPSKPYSGSEYEEQPNLPLTARLARMYMEAAV